jgi:formylglycine-generating enzyme required for sulfatase activity
MPAPGPDKNPTGTLIDPVLAPSGDAATGADIPVAAGTVMITRSLVRNGSNAAAHKDDKINPPSPPSPTQSVLSAKELKKNVEDSITTQRSNRTVKTTEPNPGEVVEVEIANGLKMKFCWIPAGKALLGSPSGEKQRSTNEAEHEFKTNGFWLGKYAVTQEQWEALMGNNPSYFSKQGGGKGKVQGMDISGFPVERVSGNDCQDFLKKLNEKVKVPPA